MIFGESFTVTIILKDVYGNITDDEPVLHGFVHKPTNSNFKRISLMFTQDDVGIFSSQSDFTLENVDRSGNCADNGLNACNFTGNLLIEVFILYDGVRVYYFDNPSFDQSPISI